MNMPHGGRFCGKTRVIIPTHLRAPRNHAAVHDGGPRLLLVPAEARPRSARVFTRQTRLYQYRFTRNA